MNTFSKVYYEILVLGLNEELSGFGVLYSSLTDAEAEARRLVEDYPLVQIKQVSTITHITSSLHSEFFKTADQTGVSQQLGLL